MTLVTPAALYLLSASGGIVLLYFLHTRSRREEVSDLFLWEGLESEPRSRAARVRMKLDPILLLELLVLALVTFALAGPALRVARPHLVGMAIVLDGSASMRSQTDDGAVRYELARKAALDLLRRYRGSPVTVIQLSHSPRVLSTLSTDRSNPERAVSLSEPTYLSDGSATDLLALLESQGGTSRFDRIFWLGDRPLGASIPGLDETLFPLDENLSISAFQVRANPDGWGSTGFVELSNAGRSYREGRVRITDGSRTATLPFLLAPGQKQPYVLPLPGSFGPAFIASVDPKDSFPDDDVRYFALSGRVDRRVRWVGEPNRYLLAALEAAMPLVVLLPDDPSVPDLTVVYSSAAPEDLTGNILLVHSSLGNLVQIADDAEPGGLGVFSPNDALLADVDPYDFRVRSTPSTTVAQGGNTVLSLGSVPFLWRYGDLTRRVVLISPNLMETNLPLTVDFPLLIRNAARWLAASLSQSPVATALVGDPILASNFGRLFRLKGPSGENLPLPEGSELFVPGVPGVYALTTDRGTYTVAANLDPRESEPAPDNVAVGASNAAAESRAESLFGLWPYIAALALLALVLEDALYRGVAWRRSP